MHYDDILYQENNGVATITLNRPERYNAFRGQTCLELIDAFNRGSATQVRLINFLFFK